MTDWEIVKNQAEKFALTNTEWTSFIQKKRYSIRGIDSKYIFVNRIDGGEVAILSKINIESAMKKLRTSGSVKKGLLLSSVARESTLIHLHSSLRWDATNKQAVYIASNPIDTAKEILDEAGNENLEKVFRQIWKRTQQSKFRKSLLKAYDFKCSITGSDIETVLEAAHITFHSKSGINESNNGLLLRSDLHILFDANMVLIHPSKLTVHIHPTIMKSEYSKYDGKQLRNRTDKKMPDSKHLNERWNAVEWTKRIK